MVKSHSEANDTLLIPSPSLAELLTAVPDVIRAVEVINDSAAMDIASFDGRCAIELGIETQSAIKAGDKRGGVQAGWQEVKFDRQIAIIAKVNGAEIFYTDDRTQTAFAEKLGMKVLHTWNLPLPPAFAQMDLLSGDT